MPNHIRTLSPSTEDVLFDHPGTSFEEASQIVRKSHEAFLSYKKLSIADRKAIIKNGLNLIDEKKQTLAAELTAQMGRPIAFAEKEIETMRKRADYLLGISDDSLTSIPGQREDEFRRFVKKEPLGVVLISSAWNVRFEQKFCGPTGSLKIIY